MAMRDIPRDEWREFCDRFSRDHQDWTVTVQVEGGQAGSHSEIRDLPFKGISADLKTRNEENISIQAGEIGSDITHTVIRPTRVRCEEQNVNSIEIEAADGSRTVARFQGKQTLRAGRR